MLVEQMYTHCPDPHPAFIRPPEDTVIWHYMSLPKLLALLDSRQLFFCRASKLGDRFEGAIPRETDATLQAWERTAATENPQ